MVENTKQKTAPTPYGRDEELYAQIAAGDEIQVQTKQRSSLMMSLMVEYMRLTLAIDALRRDYQKPFRILGIVWASMMSIVYLCGLSMFCILLVSYMRFPTYIENYLKDNGVLYDSMKIPGYIISRVRIRNLHDKNNSYQIDELDISSTFADFLNRRIKDLSVKGAHLTLTSDNLSDFFSNISIQNALSRDGKAIRVDTLKVSDSEVILKGDDYEIPINISLTGVYGRETNISSYISITQPSLEVKGPLTIRNQGKQFFWDLEIQSGLVSFPKRPQENLSGKVAVTTKATDIVKLSANLNLLYDKMKKTVLLNLDKKGKEFDAKLDLKWLDISDPKKVSQQTKFNLSASKLMISPSGKIQTNAPLKLNFSTTALNIKLDDIKGDLKGELICNFPQSCSYSLQKKSSLTIKEIQLPLVEGIWNSVGLSTIPLKPNKDFLHFSIPEGEIKLNTNISDLSLYGKQKQNDEATSIAIDTLELKTLYNIWERKISSALSARQLNYISPSYELRQTTLDMNDVFNKSQKISLISPNVLLKDTSYIQIPFQLNYVKENDLTSLSLNTKKKDITLSFLGYLDILAGNVNGQLVIPKFSLNALLDIHNQSETIENLSGEIAAYGKLDGNIRTGINGPFYIALSNVGLKTKDIELDGINTVLSMQSLVPFVTLPKQPVFIKKIKSVFPIDDIEMLLRLENRFAQISSLTANIVGIPFTAEDTLVPYKNVATLLYLRNEDSDISDLKNALSVPNWKIGGNLYGSIFLPIEIKNMALSVRNASIQLSDAQLDYTGSVKKKPKFLDKEKQFFVKSGSVLIDTKENNRDEVNITFLMDILLGENSKIKKNIRETITTDISGFMKSKEKESKQIPQNIENQIEKIFKNTSSFLIK